MYTRLMLILDKAAADHAEMTVHLVHHKQQARLQGVIIISVDLPLEPYHSQPGIQSVPLMDHR